MGTTIFLVVLLLIAVGCGIASFFVKPGKYASENYPLFARIAAGVVGAVFVVATIFSCSTVVSTRNVGIVTTMGRPNGELSNGLHLVAPWQDVTEMDGAIQLQKFEGNNAMQVRLGNNSTANANVTIQWRLAPKSAPSLFLDYRTFGKIEENLVDKELGVAMNSELSKFDPLAPGNSDGAPLVAISDHVQQDVQTAVGNRIEIQKVFIPLISYDQQTQDRINALNIEKANTRVAEQAEQTAKAQAKANEELSQSVSHDPNVVVNNCMAAAIAKGISPFGCWPGAGAVPTTPVPGR